MWERLIPHLDHAALALDLPGRGTRPADLDKLSLSAFADAAAEDIEDAGLSDVVLVGHSMTGAVLPAVADRASGKVRHLVFVACLLPPTGGRILDLYPSPVQLIMRGMAWRARRDPSIGLSIPAPIAKRFLGPEVDEATAQLIADRSVTEPAGLLTERVERSEPPPSVSATWIRTLRDRAVRISVQNRGIAALGPDTNVVDLDAGHEVMLTHPAKLAAALNRVALQSA